MTKGTLILLFLHPTTGSTFVLPNTGCGTCGSCCCLKRGMIFFGYADIYSLLTPVAVSRVESAFRMTGSSPLSYGRTIMPKRALICCCAAGTCTPLCVKARCCTPFMVKLCKCFCFSTSATGTFIGFITTCGTSCIFG